jgi:hypothetical protein
VVSIKIVLEVQCMSGSPLEVNSRMGTSNMLLKASPIFKEEIKTLRSF